MKLDHVGIATSDLDDSLRFWRTVLGLELISTEAVHDQQVRVLVRVPRSASMPLAAALQAAQGVRSARKDVGAVRVQLDPDELI